MRRRRAEEPGDLKGCWAGSGLAGAAPSLACGSFLYQRRRGNLLLCVRAGPALTVQRPLQLVVDSPILSVASHTGFLGLVPPPGSLLSGRRSCLFAGLRAPRPAFMCHRRRRPAAELQEEDPGDSDEDPAPRQQGEGQEEPEPPADTDLFRSGCISGLNQGAGSLVQQTSKMPNSVSHSKGLFV